MASAERRVGKVVAYPPLVEMSAEQRPEFHEALLEADDFDELSGKWQPRSWRQTESPKLRVVTRD